MQKHIVLLIPNQFAEIMPQVHTNVMILALKWDKSLAVPYAVTHIRRLIVPIDTALLCIHPVTALTLPCRLSVLLQLFRR